MMCTYIQIPKDRIASMRAPASSVNGSVTHMGVYMGVYIRADLELCGFRVFLNELERRASTSPPILFDHQMCTPKTPRSAWTPPIRRNNKNVTVFLARPRLEASQSEQRDQTRSAVLPAPLQKLTNTNRLSIKHQLTTIVQIEHNQEGENVEMPAAKW